MIDNPFMNIHGPRMVLFPHQISHTTSEYSRVCWCETISVQGSADFFFRVCWLGTTFEYRVCWWGTTFEYRVCWWGTAAASMWVKILLCSQPVRQNDPNEQKILRPKYTLLFYNFGTICALGFLLLWILMCFVIQNKICIHPPPLKKKEKKKRSQQLSIL